MIKKFFTGLRREESGYAIILAIMVLAILMVGGLMSSQTSITDLGTARTTALFTQALAAAESAGMTAVQLLEAETDHLRLMPEVKPGDLPWITKDEDAEVPSWINMNVADFPTIKRAGAVTFRYRVDGWYPPPGGSLLTGVPSLKECRVIGQFATAAGSNADGVNVVMGFKKKF